MKETEDYKNYLVLLKHKLRNIDFIIAKDGVEDIDPIYIKEVSQICDKLILNGFQERLIFFAVPALKLYRAKDAYKFFDFHLEDIKELLLINEQLVLFLMGDAMYSILTNTLNPKLIFDFINKIQPLGHDIIINYLGILNSLTKNVINPFRQEDLYYNNQSIYPFLNQFTTQMIEADKILNNEIKRINRLYKQNIETVKFYRKNTIGKLIYGEY